MPKEEVTENKIIRVVIMLIAGKQTKMPAELRKCLRKVSKQNWLIFIFLISFYIILITDVCSFEMEMKPIHLEVRVSMVNMDELRQYLFIHKHIYILKIKNMFLKHLNINSHKKCNIIIN